MTQNKLTESHVHVCILECQNTGHNCIEYTCTIQIYVYCIAKYFLLTYTID